VDIHETDVSEMVAYQRGVRRPQLFAVIFRILGVLVVALSLLGIVVEIVTDNESPYGFVSLVSGLFMLAISVLLDWCAIVLLTLRYGTRPEE
jgi:hypothetical protein